MRRIIDANASLSAFGIRIVIVSIVMRVRDITKRRVSEGTKKRVAHRQNYMCVGACKRLLPPTYQIDHIRALFHGGENDEANLQALCPNCHADKTQKELVTGINKHCGECNVVYSPYFVHRCKTHTSLRRFLPIDKTANL